MNESTTTTVKHSQVITLAIFTYTYWEKERDWQKIKKAKKNYKRKSEEKKIKKGWKKKEKTKVRKRKINIIKYFTTKRDTDRNERGWKKD